MAYRLLDSGSDVIVESDGADYGDALLGLAQAFSHVTTMGATIEPRVEVPIRLEVAGDAPRLAVAFVNELVFLFSTQAFLPARGRLRVEARGESWRVEGTLEGDAFDPRRHPLGTEVKAATFHDARLVRTPTGATARVLLDL